MLDSTRDRHSRCNRRSSVGIALGLVAVCCSLPARADVTSNRGAVRAVRPVGRETGPPRPNAEPTRPAPSPIDDERLLRRPTGQPSSSSATANGVGSPITTVLASLFVIGLVVSLGRLWRKHGPKLAGGLPAEAIEWLGRRPVDAKQSIHLVRLGHRILVLGSSAEGLRTLAEIDDPVEVDYLAGLCRSAANETPVADTFRALFGRRESEPNERPAPVSSPAPAAPPSERSAPEDPAIGDDALRRRLAARMQSAPETTMTPGEVPGA